MAQDKLTKLESLLKSNMDKLLETKSKSKAMKSAGAKKPKSLKPSEIHIRTKSKSQKGRKSTWENYIENLKALKCMEESNSEPVVKELLSPKALKDMDESNSEAIIKEPSDLKALKCMDESNSEPVVKEPVKKGMNEFISLNPSLVNVLAESKATKTVKSAAEMRVEKLKSWNEKQANLQTKWKSQKAVKSVVKIGMESSETTLKQTRVKGSDEWNSKLPVNFVVTSTGLNIQVKVQKPGDSLDVLETDK